EVPTTVPKTKEGEETLELPEVPKKPVTTTIEDDAEAEIASAEVASKRKGLPLSLSLSQINRNYFICLHLLPMLTNVGVFSFYSFGGTTPCLSGVSNRMLQ